MANNWWNRLWGSSNKLEVKKRQSVHEEGEGEADEVRWFADLELAKKTALDASYGRLLAAVAISSTSATLSSPPSDNRGANALSPAPLSEDYVDLMAFIDFYAKAYGLDLEGHSLPEHMARSFPPLTLDLATYLGISYDHLLL